MKWGIKDNQRIESKPNIKNVTCPLCNTVLIPKCGRIKQWHFAHKSLKDCDNWNEPETEWHLNWKNLFPKEQQEVIIGNHRADIKIKNKVIELQNSSISPNEIEDRENFYGNMVWILNGNKFAKNLDLRYKEGYFSFRWKYPPKSWWTSRREIYIDLSPLIKTYKHQIKKWKNTLETCEPTMPQYEYELQDKVNYLIDKINLYSNKLFLVKKVYPNCPCGGWGILISKKEFIKELIKDKGDDAKQLSTT